MALDALSESRRSHVVFGGDLYDGQVVEVAFHRPPGNRQIVVNRLSVLPQRAVSRSRRRRRLHLLTSSHSENI